MPKQLHHFTILCMSESIFTREEMLIGSEALEKLKHAHVLVFGVGGVGGYVVEALTRSGVGEITIVDNDYIVPSNCNRQIIALHSSIGEAKVSAFEKRMKDINPDIIVHPMQTFYLPENRDQFDFSKYDYVVDAIDTVTAKIDIIQACYEKQVPVISCMGCGNRLDPTKLEVTDIYKTKNDPLAKVMRHELKKRNIRKCTVICSAELPVKTGQRTPGSSAFVPSCAGLIAASVIVRKICNIK